MTNAIENRNWGAVCLGLLQLFIGLGAIPAGIALMTDPSGSSLGTPIELLNNTPFTDFLIPGIFLFAVNGIGSLIGGAASLLLYRRAGEIAIGLGAFLILWILVQVLWMGIHWLHVLYFIVGVAEVALGLMLRAKRRKLTIGTQPT